MENFENEYKKIATTGVAFLSEKFKQGGIKVTKIIYIFYTHKQIYKNNCKRNYISNVKKFRYLEIMKALDKLASSGNNL